MDIFGRRRTELTAPLSNSESVAAGEDHEFANVTRGLLVTGDGNLTIRMVGDQSDLTLAVKAGFFPPLRVSHVRRTSTASCVGFW